MWRIFNKLFFVKDAYQRELIAAIRILTGRKPRNLKLYQLALQHRSANHGEASNERLEFLGDAVLSLIIGEYLFKKYPNKEEGFLTEIRSRIVNRASLGYLAKKIGIPTLLKHDKSLAQQGGRFVYGNALEALIGAVYLDQGYISCKHFVLDQLLHLYIDLEALIENYTNYKSQLVTWGNRSQKKVTFKIISEQRKQGMRSFTAQVIVDNEVAGEGKGGSKKLAEQHAALVALKGLPATSA